MSISQKQKAEFAARSATVQDQKARVVAEARGTLRIGDEWRTPKTAADLEVARHATYPTTAGEELIPSVVGPGLNGARWIALEAEVIGQSTRVGFARLP